VILRACFAYLCACDCLFVSRGQPKENETKEKKRKETIKNPEQIRKENRENEIK
jgi:hypothetical protein